MKRLSLFAVLLTVVISLASCNHEGHSYEDFVGTWGVEHIEYYTIDYAGNPISNTITSMDFTLGDPKDGIDLVFRADKKGEMRDRSRDTIYDLISNDPEPVYDTIYAPDTTLITKFSYSFDIFANINK